MDEVDIWGARLSVGRFEIVRRQVELLTASTAVVAGLFLGRCRTGCATARPPRMLESRKRQHRPEVQISCANSSFLPPVRMTSRIQTEAISNTSVVFSG